METTSLMRALEHAPRQSSQQQARAEREFFCFRLGELSLGVPSETVREVLRCGLLTPLPRAPSFIMGVAGHRGEVLPVLDLLRFLGKGEARLRPRSRLFVGTCQGYTAAVLVDSVGGLARFPVSGILPAPMGGDVATEHLLGVVPVAGGQVRALLDFSKLLATARQRAVAR